MERFKSELDRAIDEALSRGAEPLEIDEVASRRLANYTTTRVRMVVDTFIKSFLVVSCATIATSIYALKAWAEWTGHRVPDDQWLNWISGICVLAASAQFFPVEKVINLFRRTKVNELICLRSKCRHREREK